MRSACQPVSSVNARFTVTTVPSAALIRMASVMPSSACAATSRRSSLSRRSVTSVEVSSSRREGFSGFLAARLSLSPKLRLGAEANAWFDGTDVLTGGRLWAERDAELPG